MKRDLKDYFEDILKAVNSINKFTKGFNFNSLVAIAILNQLSKKVILNNIKDKFINNQ